MEKYFFLNQGEHQFIKQNSQQKFFSYQENHQKITIFIKNLKIGEAETNLFSQKFLQIKTVANLLITYLSKDKIQNHFVYFQALASLDSLLSTFKLNLYSQLHFDKIFYKNIQKQFEKHCLNLEYKSKEQQNRIIQFQLYSIFYLIVMLIYFSGKKLYPFKEKIPLKIMSKPFINSLLTANFQITLKNERIISLILAYLAKSINLKIYGQRMLKFIMEHFEDVKSSKTLHHFIYVLREIYIQRQISLKMILRYKIVQKLTRFLVTSFFSAESLYVVDYLNLLLTKHPSLCSKFQIKKLLQQFLSVKEINELSILHQDLLLQIQLRIIYDMKNEEYLQSLYQKCIIHGSKNDYCLRVLMQMTGNLSQNFIIKYLQNFFDCFKQICQKLSIKSLLFCLQILGKSLILLSSCNNKYLISYIKQAVEPMFFEIKDLSVCRKELKMIEYMLEQMISIQNNII